MGSAMREIYFLLAALHVVSLVVTGMMWTTLILRPTRLLERHHRDIRAVHFGSLYLVPWFLGLAYAFERLQVPTWHQVFFPAGLGLLVLFSGIGWLFPIPDDVDPFRFWTRGWGKVLSLIGLACLVGGLLWTAAVLVWYSLG
jgi:hypothetical protein